MTISELIKTINDTADCPDHVSQEERLELRTACERLRGSLESPLDASLRFGFAVFSSNLPQVYKVSMRLKLVRTGLRVDGTQVGNRHEVI